MPSAFIKNGVKAGQFINKAKTNRQVLESTVNTISKDAIKNVLDLINDNNLYRGEEWKSSLKILLFLLFVFDFKSSIHNSSFLFKSPVFLYAS